MDQKRSEEIEQAKAVVNTLKRMSAYTAKITAETEGLGQLLGYFMGQERPDQFLETGAKLKTKLTGFLNSVNRQCRIASRDIEDEARAIELAYGLQTPIFRHTHRCCTFLGTYQGPSIYHTAQASVQADLYFCPQSGKVPTIICRTGDEAGDYMSGIECARRDYVKSCRDRTFHSPMGEGYRRAWKLEGFDYTTETMALNMLQEC